MKNKVQNKETKIEAGSGILLWLMIPEAPPNSQSSYQLVAIKAESVASSSTIFFLNNKNNPNSASNSNRNEVFHVKGPLRRVAFWSSEDELAQVCNQGFSTSPAKKSGGAKNFREP
jgi:hypothetical protein